MNCSYCRQVKEQVKRAKFNRYKVVSIVIRKKDKLCHTHKALVRKWKPLVRKWKHE